MDLNVIEKVLYACSDVHNVKVVDMTIFREEEYQKIIECDLSVAKQVVPIVVAVPQNWQRTLIDIYIAQNMTFPFIPHVDIKGKFCLFETEGVLIDQNLGGIILQSIEKAKEIMKESPDLFIKDIAMMVGFSDQFYFSRIFHSITGMSPAEYIKNYKNMDNYSE